MGNWADLPIEVLGEMLTKLPAIEDLIRFGCVCGSWRHASLESKKMKKSFIPWIMLSEPEPQENFLDEETLMLITMFNQPEEEEEPFKNEDKDKDDVPRPRKFVNVSSKKTVELYLPEAEGKRCFGSNFGWILTMGLDFNIHLLNPLTRVQISLPPKATFGYQFHLENEYDETYDPFHGEGEIRFLRRVYLDKFAFSAHPNHSGSWVVMVIYSEQRLLAIARPGDKAWTDVKCHLEWFDDVIFFKKAFFAIQHLGDLVVCNVTTPVPVATHFMPPPLRPKDSNRCRYYLVEMSGRLHLVARLYISGLNNLDDYFKITVRFKVYRLDFRKKKWIKLRKLGKYALFLGNNTSFAISHPALRKNCIYFTDDFVDAYRKANCDIGVFDFGEKKVVDSLYSSDCARSTFCPPLFFIPSLH